MPRAAEALDVKAWVYSHMHSKIEHSSPIPSNPNKALVYFTALRAQCRMDGNVKLQMAMSSCKTNGLVKILRIENIKKSLFFSFFSGATIVWMPMQTSLEFVPRSTDNLLCHKKLNRWHPSYPKRLQW
jgi:hypothetical protein